MSVPNGLSPDVAKLIFGTPWGTVFPNRANPAPLAYDGRSVALGTLKKYLAEITFRRPGGRTAAGVPLPPIDFRIPAKDIQIGWPDSEKEQNFPSMTFLHSPASYAMIGLAGYIDETTKDQFGVGTVVQWMSEHQETFQIEVWANKRAELRSILAGIETSLSPTEQMYGIRFIMPDYFNQLVRFTPIKRQEFDEQDSARNRRRARIDIEMAFHVVTLVNYSLVRPTLKVVVDGDIDTNTPVTEAEVQPPISEHACDPCG